MTIAAIGEAMLYVGMVVGLAAIFVAILAAAFALLIRFRVW